MSRLASAANRCCTALILSFCVAVIAHAGDIDGTWRLVKRVLPDGTVLTPPAVQGMGTAIGGTPHLNVFWQTPDGKPASIGVISKYRLSANTYSETLLAAFFDDGSGNPVAYNLSGETKSVRVDR